MLSRSITVALISGAMLGPVAAGQLSPEEARQFIAGKYFPPLPASTAVAAVDAS